MCQASESTESAATVWRPAGGRFARSCMPRLSALLRFENGRLQTGNGILRVYNAGGALIHIANVTEKKGSVDFSTLPAGLYIVSQGKETIKIKK